MITLAQFLNSEPYDIRLWKCTDFTRHWHASTEIYICQQGVMEITVEGTHYRLCPGAVVMVAGNEVHEIFCNTPETWVVLISFGEPLLGNRYRFLENASMEKPFFYMDDPSVSPEILHPLQEIQKVLLQNDGTNLSTDWKLRGALFSIACYLFEHKLDKPLSAERMLRARQRERLSATLEFIADHYRQQITLEQAASIAGYERSYFSKLFRDTMGMTFHRYLNFVRVSVACRLLTEQKGAISAVAEQVGFTSQKNLSRLFQEVLGMSPSQYKKLPPEEKSGVMPL